MRYARRWCTLMAAEMTFKERLEVWYDVIVLESLPYVGDRVEILRALGTQTKITVVIIRRNVQGITCNDQLNGLHAICVAPFCGTDRPTFISY